MVDVSVSGVTHHHHPALFAAITKNITQHGLPLSPKTSPTIVSNQNQHQKHRLHHLMLNESYPQKRVNHDESRIAGDKTAYLQTKYFCSFLKKKWGVLLPRFQTSAILNSILLYNLVFSEPVSKSWFIKELNVTIQNKYCHISRSKILSLPSTIPLDDQILLIIDQFCPHACQLLSQCVLSIGSNQGHLHKNKIG